MHTSTLNSQHPPERGGVGFEREGERKGGRERGRVCVRERGRQGEGGRERARARERERGRAREGEGDGEGETREDSERGGGLEGELIVGQEKE